MANNKDELNTLSHTKWNCRYHVVFAPKYRRKVFYDASYLKNVSFSNDFRIILKSIVVVFSRADVLELQLHDINK